VACAAAQLGLTRALSVEEVEPTIAISSLVVNAVLMVSVEIV